MTGLCHRRSSAIANRNTTEGSGTMEQRSALVVDNERVIVELIGTLLCEQGYRVEKALGGMEALHILKRQTFDIVFLDLIMPRVGGERICRFIRQSPRHRHTKVIIVSAVALEGQRQIRDMAADACIAKAAFPQLKKNITAALTLLETGQPSGGDMILGREGVHPRTVVRELLFAQRHFEAILSSMHEAVIELDTDCVITYTNPAAQQILNKQEWELIGRDFTDGFSGSQLQDVQKILSELLRSSAGVSRKITGSMMNREYELCFSSVIRDNALIGITVVATDISEKTMLENERLLRERLVGVIEMAGAAAHELNQPLAVISGHAQLLLKNSLHMEENVLRRIRTILEQVERLGRLTGKFTNIVAYKTKDFGRNIKIVDIEKSSRKQPDTGIQGFWD